MAAEIEWEERGWDKLAAKLTAAAQDVKGPRTRRMVRAGAEIFKQEMVRRAPLLAAKNSGSDSLNPGELKAGIRVRMAKNTDLAEARIGPGTSRLIGPATEVEYGHREVHGGSLKMLGGGRTRGSGTAGEDVPAHPFVRPAYESARDDAERAMMQDFDQPLEGLG